MVTGSSNSEVWSFIDLLTQYYYNQILYPVPVFQLWKRSMYIFDSEAYQQVTSVILVINYIITSSYVPFWDFYHKNRFSSLFWLLLFSAWFIIFSDWCFSLSILPFAHSSQAFLTVIFALALRHHPRREVPFCCEWVQGYFWSFARFCRQACCSISLYWNIDCTYCC